jgi:hypothetical protein
MLYLAVKNTSVQLLHTLLDLGCDPNVPGKLRRSVLRDVVRFGIDDGRLLHRLISSETTEVVDAKGKTVWHEAALREISVVSDLSSKSMDPVLHYSVGHARMGTPQLSKQSASNIANVRYSSCQRL